MSHRNSPVGSPIGTPTKPIFIPQPQQQNVDFDGESDVTYQTVKPKKINQYVLGEILGEGSYAKVREAIDSNTLKRVAVKIIKSRVLKKITGAMAALNREINIMRKLKHKNVIQLYEVIRNEEKGKIYIVIEFAGAGSLQQVINATINKKLPMSDVWHFFTQLIEGLEYIHNQGVIHRDIKPANLMITPDRVLKLCDFGTASELNQFTQSDECTQSNGTPAFQSPQVATGEKQFSGFKLDIWAAGVTLYYLVTGVYPFEGDTVFSLYEAIAKCEYKMPSYAEPDLRDLIRGMMDKDENTRFTIQQIKANRWFNTSQYADMPQPNLVDRWKSFSLSPFIASAVSTMSSPMDIRRMSLSPMLIGANGARGSISGVKFEIHDRPQARISARFSAPMPTEEKNQDRISTRFSAPMPVEEKMQDLLEDDSKIASIFVADFNPPRRNSAPDHISEKDKKKCIVM